MKLCSLITHLQIGTKEVFAETVDEPLEHFHYINYCWPLQAFYAICNELIDILNKGADD